MSASFTLPLVDGESVTYAPDCDILSRPPDLRFVHFNDVYHLDPSSAEPVGGAARFQTVMNEYRRAERFAGQAELITLFSGDAYNPSLESSVTKGSHMVPILNNLGTAAACIGNHDLDFGVEQFRYLAAKCSFPWLVANVFDPESGAGANMPIGGALPTYMITASNGLQVGLVGLGEREWLGTVNSLPSGVVYASAAATAKRLIPELRRAGADIVIVLSHAREPNDVKLAEILDGAADLILGGHDHYYNHQRLHGTPVLRSGSDFKQLSYIEAWRRLPGAEGERIRWDVAIRRRDIDSAVVPDGPTLALVDSLTAKLKQSLDKCIGWTAVPLDARFTTVRMEESNLANLVCDIMRHHYQADCVIMAAGTMRGDQVYPPGPLRIRDITDCFPFEDPVVVLRVSGRAILSALENGVSLYPALEGRFPHVSNMTYEFDPASPPGSRITQVELGGGPLDMQKQYVLCTRGYMARGKDGYESLLVKSAGGLAEELVDEETGMLISMMLRQYFMALKVLDRWPHWSAPLENHWDRVVSDVAKKHPNIAPGPADAPASPVDSLAVPFDEHVVDGASPLPDPVAMQEADRKLAIMRRVAHKWCRLAGVQGRNGDIPAPDECVVSWTQAIAPCIEGRIRIVR